MESDFVDVLHTTMEVPETDHYSIGNNVTNADDGGQTEHKRDWKNESRQSNEESKQTGYLQELYAESEFLALNPTTFYYTRKLLQNEINKYIIAEQQHVEDNASSNKISSHFEVDRKVDTKNLGTSSRRPFDNEEHVNLREKVFFPVDDHPQYNFVGTLLGQNGSNLKRIASITKTKISVLGKGSTRNRSREEKLGNSGEPQYQHFNETLHVLIQAAGPRYQTQHRIDSAIEEIKPFTVVSDEHNVTETPPEYEERVNLSEKIFIPVNEYPSYNFVGKILGTRGSNLRNIAGRTKTRISILGKGSTKDKVQEEEDTKSSDPGYRHLLEPLHVLIQVAGPKAQTQERLSKAVEEIEKYMDPTNEEIKQKQWTEYTAMKYGGTQNNTLYSMLQQPTCRSTPYSYPVLHATTQYYQGRVDDKFVYSDNADSKPLKSCLRKPSSYGDGMDAFGSEM